MHPGQTTTLAAKDQPLGIAAPAVRAALLANDEAFQLV
jgi:hypothetical protein